MTNITVASAPGTVTLLPLDVEVVLAGGHLVEAVTG